jgi:cyclopropane-fatty-acyl-phospholipid synthase
MKPFYENVQAHYDLSDDFFALFLDPSRTYSCAYFEREDMTLAEAQRAKIDLALGKCDLKPDQTLLDIGCGWGATVRRAVEKYGVRAIGLTLSKNQQAYAAEATRGLPIEIRLQGWEEFDEPVDRIVSIGAFEHFRQERYPAFFEKCFRLLPAGASMLLHTIVFTDHRALAERGVSVEHENVMFAKFIRKYIFPGGELPFPSTVVARAQDAGFQVTRQHHLGPHYARTLTIWAENLAAAKDRAIELTSRETYDIYMKYLTGCAQHFTTGHIDIVQFSLHK